PCIVELTLSAYRSGGPGRGPGLEADKQRPTLTATVGADGTFRFHAVTPGVHTLRAVCPSARALALVTVGLERETVVAPLLLGDTPLALALEPPLDPSGSAWNLTLSTGDAVPLRVVGSAATPAGTWRVPGLPVGAY